MQHQPSVDLKPYFLTLDDLDEVIEWADFFGNANPVEIDVGSGRGLFLVNVGSTNPETNYLGCEIEYKEGRHAARRLKKRDMLNVRVVGGDVKILLASHVPPSSVAAIHVYFPDPWWKKKHHRRRVFTDHFVSQMATALSPGGLVHSWTDVEDYFTVISALMDHDRRFEKLPAPTQRAAEHDLDYQTSFERKKRKADCTIWRGLWRLKTES